MGLGILSPAIAPVGSIIISNNNNVETEEEHWRNFGNSVDAVSFGFVATAILISMFLIMALLEKFLRPRSTVSGRRNSGDLEAPVIFTGKLDYPSPKTTVYSREVSVLMPGEETPTFIANPAPAPCPPEPISRPLNQHYTFTDTCQSLNLR